MFLEKYWHRHEAKVQELKTKTGIPTKKTFAQESTRQLKIKIKPYKKTDQQTKNFYI